MSDKTSLDIYSGGPKRYDEAVERMRELEDKIRRMTSGRRNAGTACAAASLGVIALAVASGFSLPITVFVVASFVTSIYFFGLSVSS